MGPRVETVEKTRDTILGRDDIGVILTGKYGVNIPLVTPVNVGVKVIIHPDGRLVQFNRSQGLNNKWDFGVGGSTSGGLLFNVDDLDEAASVNQSTTIGVAVGGGFKASRLESSTGGLDDPGDPWGIAIGPKAGVRFEWGREMSTWSTTWLRQDAQ